MDADPEETTRVSLKRGDPQWGHGGKGATEKSWSPMWCRSLSEIRGGTSARGRAGRGRKRGQWSSEEKFGITRQRNSGKGVKFWFGSEPGKTRGSGGSGLRGRELTLAGLPGHRRG